MRRLKFDSHAYCFIYLFLWKKYFNWFGAKKMAQALKPFWFAYNQNVILFIKKNIDLWKGFKPRTEFTLFCQELFTSFEKLIILYSQSIGYSSLNFQKPFIAALQYLISGNIPSRLFLSLFILYFYYTTMSIYCFYCNISNNVIMQFNEICITIKETPAIS